ncbi:MAG: glycoside hydrolase family 5 protein [Butyrivibrio sp.]
MKKARVAIMAVMLAGIMLFSGCTEGNSLQTAGTVEDVSVNDTTEGTEQVTEKEPVIKTENINKDMENMDAMSVVKEIKFGFSIGNTLDSTSDTLIRVEPPFKFETAWGNPKITQELIDAMIDAGANVIRIPVSWKDHIADGPDYTIVESWMKRVKEVVDYAYDRGVYVILNLHHEDWNYPYYDNEEAACAEMSAIWGQIAETFKDYDEHLIFEGQNEPRKVGTKLEWNGGDKEGWDVVNATNKAFIDTVRNSGGSNPYRLLMIPGYAANSTVGIKHLQIPEDDNRIIVSVHAYVPYSFALDTKGTDKWNNNTKDIDTLMNDLKTLFTDKGIPVIIGEFGAVNKDNESERAEWVSYYINAAKEIGVPCVWWDNGAVKGDGENFGMIDRKTYEVLFPETMTAIRNAIEQ